MPICLRRGVYETVYGNAAYVHGPNAKYGFDLDMAESIPIAMVTDNFLREADEADCMDEN